MDEADWKVFRKCLDDYMYRPVTLEADGYRITFSSVVSGIVPLGINGEAIKKSHTQEDTEERRRFMQPVKIDGKISYTYIWDNAERLQEHLIKNNKDIKLIGGDEHD